MLKCHSLQPIALDQHFIGANTSMRVDDARLQCSPQLGHHGDLADGEFGG